MTVLVLAIAGLLLALLPAALFLANWRAFHPLPRVASGTPLPAVSVLIPARNEERSIVAAVESALGAADGIEVEVIVLDDASDDATAPLVRELAIRDTRVRLAAAPPLPRGWCGKSNACQALAGLARHDLFLWVDADVRLAPGSLARVAGWMRDHPAVGLLSGFPREETGTWLEHLLIPLIHFVLLGYLPLTRMRASTQPALSAGCGQLMIARRGEYDRAGGHAAVATWLHDGIMLTRAFRRAGIATDLFDATDAARCRMYDSAAATWSGLAKNATEAMAAPGAIGPWTVLLFGGQVLPALLLAWGAWRGCYGVATPHLFAIVGLSAVAVTMSLGVRLAAAMRFRQNRLAVLLHPLAILALLAVQWYALARHLAGRPATWKGRAYASGRAAAPAALTGTRPGPTIAHHAPTRL